MAPKPIDPRYQITVHSQPLDLRGLTNEQVDALRQRFAAAVDAAIERVMMSTDNLKNALTSTTTKRPRIGDVQISTNVPPGFIGPTVLWIIKPDEEHA